ncbi:MAG: hypothetical protein Q8L48_16710 [Archangium sp.]|nr:hypothetical protein [Archangium sp.]
MRQTLHLLLAAVLVFASPALAQDGLVLTSTLYTFTDCASGGSSAQTVPEGNYVLTVTDADTFLCQADSASTCATLGTKWPVGTIVKYSVGRGGLSLSCRSSTSTGDLQLTKSN